MYFAKKLSRELTLALAENGRIDESETEIYQYCYDYLFEQAFCALIVLSLGIALHCFDTTLLFFAMFDFFRKCGGGVHAPTERLCALISYGLYAVVLLVVPRCSFQNREWWLCLFAASLVWILALVPVENGNKHFTGAQRRRLKRLCAAGAAVVAPVFLFFYVRGFRRYCGTMSLGAAVVAVSMVLGLISLRGRGEHAVKDGDL